MSVERLQLVVCQDEWARVWDVLRKQAHPKCLELGLIRVWLADGEGRLFDLTSKERMSWEMISPGVTVIYSTSVRNVPEERLRTSNPVQRVATSHYFNPKRDQFLRGLEHAGISWLSHAREQHSKYDYRSSKFTVDDWLSQFDQFGERSVGETLLRHVRIKSTEECVSGFLAKWAGDPLQADARIGVLSRLGKSGAALSPGLAKSFDTECSGIGECIEVAASEGRPRQIHIFEDGLWTGIELQKVIHSLKGTIVGKPKCQPLMRQGDLLMNEVVLHFSVVTDLGHAAATSFLKREALPNFTINTDGSEWVNVLSSEAKTRFGNGEIGFDDVAKFKLPVDFVNPHIVKLVSSTGETKQVERFAQTLSTLGLHLWEQRNPAIAQTLDLSKYNYLGFGSNGIGTPIVFAHSAGQAIVPLLWCDGVIPWGARRNIEWRALYPERPRND